LPENEKSKKGCAEVIALTVSEAVDKAPALPSDNTE